MKKLLILLLGFGLASDCLAQTVIVDSFISFPPPTASPTPSAPTLKSATVDEDGLVFTMVFSGPVTASDWTSLISDHITLDNSTGAGLEYLGGDSTANILCTIHHGPIPGSDSISLSYTQG